MPKHFNITDEQINESFSHRSFNQERHVDNPLSNECRRKEYEDGAKWAIDMCESLFEVELAKHKIDCSKCQQALPPSQAALQDFQNSQGCAAPAAFIFGAMIILGCAAALL